VSIVIIRKFCYEQQLDSIVLLIIDIYSQVLLQRLILFFCLIVYLKMKNDIQSNLNFQMITKVESKIEDKQRVFIEHYRFRHFMLKKYLIE
jgi:hypothetical protein